MIDLSRSLKKSTTLYLREVCFDNQATEMSAVFDDKILTFSDPWSGWRLYSDPVCLLTNAHRRRDRKSQCIRIGLSLYLDPGRLLERHLLLVYRGS